MTAQDLEQVIHEYIRDIYKKEYIGKIHIQKLNPIGYSIKLGMDVPEKPTTIYAELEDKAFLKFLRQEIKDRLYHLVYYGKLNLFYPADCKPIKTSCACND